MGNHLSLVSNILIYCLVFSFKTVLIAQGPNALKANDPIQTLIDNMVHVQGGTFTMGCTDEQGECTAYENPPHLVTVLDYYIGRFEVTQLQWRVVMESDPPHLFNEGCDPCPVEGVSWAEVQDFILKLNDRTEFVFRLPSEAEWEFAARGGNESQGYKYSGSNNINDVAWYAANAQQGNTHGTEATTRPVGRKNPNELGIYDMSGNVREWCIDWLKGYPGSRDVRDEMGTSSRVFRGGSWLSHSQHCCVSFRDGNWPSIHSEYQGFRLARSE